MIKNDLWNSPDKLLCQITFRYAQQSIDYRVEFSLFAEIGFEMAYVVKVLLIFSTFFIFSQASDLHNDALCDSQLTYLDSAIRGRELWALNCK